METVWYYTYHGLPLCREQGRPIHAEMLGLLPPPEKIAKSIPGIKMEFLEVKSMNKQKFFRMEWPK